MSVKNVSGVSWVLESPIGPDFSDHERSTKCVAKFCPNFRLIVGKTRWIIDGKNPKSVVKVRLVVVLGLKLTCLNVIIASSSEIKRPNMVTIAAAIFMYVGIV